MAVLLFAAMCAAVSSARLLTEADMTGLYGPPRRVSGPTRALLPPLDAAQPLKDAAKAAGIYIGAAINQNGMSGGPGGAIYPDTALTQFNLYTAENECKVGPVHPRAGNSPASFNFAPCDAIMAVGPANGSVARMHNFCWHEENPDWLNALKDPAALSSALTLHIQNMTARYLGDAKLAYYAVDVVNEAVSDSGASTLKPATPWYPALPDYVERAFVAANAADAAKASLLCYNEYGAEGYTSPKAKKVIALINQVRAAAGARVDCVGLQMHISVDQHPDPADVAENIRQLGLLGLTVHITEMDIKCPNCDAGRLQAQAQLFGDMLQACLNNTNCKSFETWGIYDGDSWVGADNAPLLWDVSWKTKPAYDAVLSTLQRHAAAAERAPRV